MSLSKQEARVFAKSVWSEFLSRPENIDAIQLHLKTYLEANQYRRILATIPFSHEVDVIPTLIETRQNVYIPHVESNSEMTFHLFLSAGRFYGKIREGFRGIRGSDPESSILELPLLPSDLVLIPALALSKNGHRLGRGGGYFDRWKDRMNRASMVAVLPHELSSVDFEGEAHDLKIASFISERGFFK